MTAMGLELETKKRLLSFDHVRNQVAEAHSLKNQDVNVMLEDIRVTPELHIEIPNVGTFGMTHWSKKQLGSLLGVQWDKWFNTELVSAEQVQEELTRRFSKTKEQKKFRTSRFRHGAPGVDNCDGYLRAVLGPNYYAIDDEIIFDRLERNFSGNVASLRFMPEHLSKRGGWANDHCSHYTIVGERIDMGPVDEGHSDPRVRDAYALAKATGGLPTQDYVYPGMHMRNSEVGYTAVSINEFNFRLVCLNGMMITQGESQLLYRQHRRVDDEQIDVQLSKVFEKAPIRWESTRQTLLKMKDVQLKDPLDELKKQLEKMAASKRFQEEAAAAYEKEPLPSLYGMLQAVTRAAQSTDDMDKRFEYEAMAGQLLSSRHTKQLLAA